MGVRQRVTVPSNRLSGRMAPPPDVIWRAGADREGHAYRRAGRSRALCGREFIEERLAWPVKTKDRTCLEKVDELTRAALRVPAAKELGL